MQQDMRYYINHLYKTITNTQADISAHPNTDDILKILDDKMYD